ncbi:type II secretion system F family protein [Vulcanisaeta thermophila]|uniref:type II secretion system F family protein n=1 Tax=Vulcanisaeta thermophila TaxID=867917 RepID=UPI0009FBFADF|nr:type II secretion system F family protein [Vulcanisaeta thermophila]
MSNQTSHQSVMSDEDMVTALRRSMDRVPSPTYRDVVSTLISSYAIGSDVADVLMLKVEHLMRERENRLRTAVQTLGLLMETYLVITLLLPILLILITITLTPLGPLRLGPLVLDPTVLLLITVFVYSPIMGLIMYLIIDSTVTSLE